MRHTTDPTPSAHAAEGVDRAEALASQTMNNMIEMTELADTDTTITAMFLLVEVLASLQVYANLTPAEAIQKIQHLTAAKVACIRNEESPEAGILPPVPPATPVASNSLH